MLLCKRLLTFLLFLIPLTAFAADANPNDVSVLKGKGVFLRGAFVEDKLTFDSSGKLKGSATPGPFWFSAFEVTDVNLSSTMLEIKGHRKLLISIGQNDPPAASDLRIAPLLLDPIRISIERDVNHPDTLAAAVLKVLAPSVDDALSDKTPAERNAALNSFASVTPLSELKRANTERDQVPKHSTAEMHDIRKSLTPPRIIHSVDPQPTEKGRREKLSGVIVTSLVVDKSGMPTHIRIRRPLEQDLDQNAVVAVSQYRFAPAMLDGQPVAVEVGVEVNYRIQ